MKKFLAISLSDVVFIVLINVKMPTIVGILTFMSMINSCSAEHGKSFITTGSDNQNSVGTQHDLFVNFLLMLSNRPPLYDTMHSQV